MEQKKTTSWFITGMIICVMMLFGMAGCGSSDGEQTTEETTVEATAEEATEAPADEMLTESEALEYALDVEGLYVDDVDDISVQLNTDDGATEYDIAFQYEGVHYEYAVDAYTGDVYEYE